LTAEYTEAGPSKKAKLSATHIGEDDQLLSPAHPPPSTDKVKSIRIIIPSMAQNNEPRKEATELHKDDQFKGEKIMDLTDDQ